MKILELTLKKKWFDMIKSGEKLEEYREIKDYWINRLQNPDGSFKRFTHVRFRNGYSKMAPVMLRELIYIRTDVGNPAWGAEIGKQYFVIDIGNETPLDCNHAV